MTVVVLDPSNEERPAARQLAPRIPTLDKARIGVISNGKEGTARFFSLLAARLRDDASATVEICSKANYSAPAEAELMAQVRRWDVVVSGIGD